MAGCSGSNSGYEQAAREQGDGVRSGGACTSQKRILNTPPPPVPLIETIGGRCGGNGENLEALGD